VDALSPRPAEGATRRRFLDWFLGTSVGALLVAILYPVARYLTPPSVPEATTRQVDAGPLNDAELLERGYKIVRFGADPVIVVRVSDSDVRAFSATCTHLDCIVEFQKPQSRIYCNCHGGVYDLTGRNVAGPPPRPLERFQVNLVAAQGGQPQRVVVSRG
jgi:cytochrome b6-f complex iron-sulfur subunit